MPQSDRVQRDPELTEPHPDARARRTSRSIAGLPVALVVNAFCPLEGGAERQLRLVMQELVRVHGAFVTVVTRPVAGADHEETRSGVRILRVPETLGRAPVPSQRLIFAGVAAAVLARLRPSIVISSQLDAATVASGGYTVVCRKPQIVRLAGGSSDGSGRVADDVGGLSGARGHIITRVLSRPNVRVVAPAAHLVESGLRSGVLHRDRTTVIPNGVAFSGSLTDNDHSQPRDGVIWYGRDAPVKNVPAFVALVDAAPDRRFVAVGTVDLPARDNLERLGWVSDPQESMATCAVAVSTSRFEGSPNFLLQAISLGLRVVAFDNDAIRELRGRFPDYVSLVPMDDVAALRRGVEYALRGARLPPAPVPSIHSVANRWAQLISSSCQTRAGGEADSV